MTAAPGSTTWWCEHAWLGEAPVASVRVRVSGGRFTAVEAGVPPAPDDARLSGVVLPGLANVHSHAFHRALRGRTHAGGGTFWTWRDAMYAVAARLDPDRYLALARAAYAEMALAGVTCVGEFHYVHHAPGGTPYADPAAMPAALRQAAQDAGVRLTLLDTCYVSGGLDVGRGGGYAPPSSAQLRFTHADADAWAEAAAHRRVDGGHVRSGVAVHSVRAVPADQLGVVARAATQEASDQATGPRPLHVHLSEQPAENEACLRHHGLTPVALLAEHGVLGPATTAVHATHLTPADVALLGRSGTAVCLCPTTEADLADGIGPAADLAAAGSPLVLGSDQHAETDLLAEARRLEQHERLASGRRGRFAPAALVAAATAAGHTALGWDDAGVIAPGARADLVAVRLDSVRTAGCDPAQVVMAATAADVTDVVSGGHVVVSDGRHVLGDVGRLLAEAVAAVTA